MSRSINHKRGAALVIALWVILLLTLLVGGFAFEMHVEADIVSYYRKRLKAQHIARSGVELSKVILSKMDEVDEELQGANDDEEALLVGVVNLSRGVAIRELTRTIGEGTLTLTIEPEEGRRGINELTDADWEEILDQANIPQDQWADIIDSFFDWTDEDDLARLNGAESDDPFYEERGYQVKNAKLDTVDELLLIKHFDEELLYGSPPGVDEEDRITGIAGWLTAWSHGKINVNTASREVLMTLRDIDEFAVDDILEYRVGVDGEAGTRDDGFESVQDAIAQTGMNPSIADRLTVRDIHFLRITSIGDVGGVKAGVWAVIRVEGDQLLPLYWREEQL